MPVRTQFPVVLNQKHDEATPLRLRRQEESYASMSTIRAWGGRAGFRALGAERARDFRPGVGLRP